MSRPFIYPSSPRAGAKLPDSVSDSSRLGVQLLPAKLSFSLPSTLCYWRIPTFCSLASPCLPDRIVLRLYITQRLVSHPSSVPDAVALLPVSDVVLPQAAESHSSARTGLPLHPLSLTYYSATLLSCIYLSINQFSA